MEVIYLDSQSTKIQSENQWLVIMSQLRITISGLYPTRAGVISHLPSQFDISFLFPVAASGVHLLTSSDLTTPDTTEDPRRPFSR